MIVVDTNIILPYVFQTVATDEVLRLREREPRWCFPILWRYELANALTKYVRAGHCVGSTAERAYESALAMLVPHEAAVPDSLVLRTALAAQVTAYDAAYIALAKHLGIRLITYDKALAAKSQGVAVLVKDFLA